MLLYTLDQNPWPLPTISRKEGQAAVVAIAVIFACLATLFPAVALGQQIAGIARPLFGPLYDIIALTSMAGLIVLLCLSRAFRIGYFALLTIGWSLAAFAEVGSTAATTCAVEAALAVLALGGAATAAVRPLQ
jgi:hypothetical protein